MTARLCGARPVEGTARCDLPVGHDGRHSAPLRIGGRLSYHTDSRLPFDIHDDQKGQQ